MEAGMERGNAKPLNSSLEDTRSSLLASRISETVKRLLVDILPAGAEIHPDTPLRTYGLDSMTTARLWLKLQAEFSADLPMKWLGTRASLGQLVARIVEETRPGATLRSSHGAEILEIRADPARRFQPFGLTPIQES